MITVISSNKGIKNCKIGYNKGTCVRIAPEKYRIPSYEIVYTARRATQYLSQGVDPK